MPPDEAVLLDGELALRKRSTCGWCASGGGLLRSFGPSVDRGVLVMQLDEKDELSRPLVEEEATKECLVDVL